MIDVSIIVVSFNTKKLTLDCLKSIIAHTKEKTYEIIVVDNASEDGSVEEIQKLANKYKQLSLVKSKVNLGFGGGNNLGLKAASGRFVLLLNSDTLLFEDSISKMVDWMDGNPKVGVSTCRLLNPDSSVQATGGNAPSLFRLFAWGFFLDDLPFWSDFFGSYHPHKSFYSTTRELDWITGAFMLIKGEAAEGIKFDTKIFMYTEDVELSYRFQKRGWKLMFVPVTSIKHIGGASSHGDKVSFLQGNTGKERSIIGEFEGLKLFYKRHFPGHYDLAKLILKSAALLRWFMFGMVQGQATARQIYLKTYNAI